MHQSQLRSLSSPSRFLFIPRARSLLHHRLTTESLTMSATNTRPSSSLTNTITLEEPGRSQQTLVLQLNPRKKKVTWKAGTVDNEFMGRKSSKKCCIFHKQKSFDEDASDDDDEHDHHHHHHHHHDHNSKDAGEPSSSN